MVAAREPAALPGLAVELVVDDFVALLPVALNESPIALATVPNSWPMALATPLYGFKVSNAR